MPAALVWNKPRRHGSGLARERRDVVREVSRLLKESHAAADLPAGEEDPLWFGISRMRQSNDTLNKARTILGREAN